MDLCNCDLSWSCRAFRPRPRLLAKLVFLRAGDMRNVVYVNERAKSHCCQTPLIPYRSFTDSGLSVLKCAGCKSLWAIHTNIPKIDFWDEVNVPKAFLEALRIRRKIQAKLVAFIVESRNLKGPILDYGCGQGILLAELQRSSFEYYGCDLDLGVIADSVSVTNLIKISKPWDVPEGNWGTFMMLDVLEHHPKPADFLRLLNAENVLLKLPNCTGPFACASRMLSWIGWNGPLEKLFLVGSASPHMWLPTKKGIKEIASKAGFQLQLIRNINEVGIELRDRLRPTPTGRLQRGFLSILGVLIGFSSHFWSDSRIYLLKRS